MKDDRLYLEHMKNCIERIEAYVAEGRDTFLRDPKTQGAVVRVLQILAESATRISDFLSCS